MKLFEIYNNIIKEFRYINTSYPQFQNENPIADTETIRVYHGFNSYSTEIAKQILVKGLSGKEVARRLYSYESGNNPRGLFVSIDFNVVKKDFAGSGIIIEFSTKVSDLEAPVWVGGRSYFIQGEYTQSFKNMDEREQQRLLNRQRAGTNIYDYIKKSDRPELAETIFDNREKQALYIGDLNPNMIKHVWYHGTPDAREIEKLGGFNENTIDVDYITDPIKFKQLQEKINIAKQNNDTENYNKLLNTVDNFKKHFTYKKPLFLSNKYSIAKTYADPKRAFDYQNALEKVYEVEINCNKTVKIIADGDRFRFLNIEKVKSGFINAGVDKNEIDNLILMFNYYISDNKGIKTDVVGAIGNWLKFDCIDVIGVLDSYHGGNVKSTVKMVLNPTNVKIKK